MSAQRRFTYKSSRKQLDALLVASATRKTGIRRALEPEDNSFFYNDALNHWQEVNLTTTFQEFCDKQTRYTSSLAQLIHHAKDVFGLLALYIAKHDVLALEPLFDLLGCFVRDVGAEDFQPFYNDCLRVLVDCALFFAPNRETGVEKHVLDLFTTLSLVFKYSAKKMATPEGIETTLVSLDPLFRSSDNVARYSAESAAILLRKADAIGIQKAVDFFSACKLMAPATVIFAEAVKNALNLLRESTLRLVVALLVASDLDQVTCAVILRLILHASSSYAASVYEIVLQKLLEQPQSSAKNINLLCSLAFVDSGRKVPSWPNLCDAFEKTIETSDSLDNPNLSEKIVFFLTITLRNAPMAFLAPRHALLFKIAAQSPDFLGFMDCLLDVAREKATVLGLKYAAELVMRNWQSNEARIGVFQAKTEGKMTKIAPELRKKLQNDLEHQTDPEQAFWRALVIRWSPDGDFTSYLSVFSRFFSATALPTALETCGVVLECMTKVKFEDDAVLAVLKQFVAAFDVSELTPKEGSIYESETLFEGAASLIGSIPESYNNSVTFITQNLASLVACAGPALLVTLHGVRSAALSYISSLYAKQNGQPELITAVQGIEAMPLTLQNGREFLLRFKRLAGCFGAESRETRQLGVMWVFGILLSRFKPLWDAIFEVFPSLCGLEEAFVWDCIDFFLHKKYAGDEQKKVEEEQELSSEETPEVDEDNDVKMESVDLLGAEKLESTFLEPRLRDMELRFLQVVGKYRHAEEYLVSVAREKRSSVDETSFIRMQVLKCLQKVPSLAEKRARFLVPLLLDPENTPGWTVRDRNVLVDIFGLFKNIKNIYRTEEVKVHALRLLSSRTPAMQRAALRIILAYKEPGIKEYSDNLSNILDKTSYRDEITTFYAAHSAQNLEKVTEVILRILYGKHKIKLAKKELILQFLGSVGEAHVTNFLALGMEDIPFSSMYSAYSEGKDADTIFADLDERVLRHLTGFVSLVGEVVSELRTRFPKAVESTLKGVIFATGAAQHVLESPAQPQLARSARAARTQGLKDLAQISGLFADVFPWTLYESYLYDLVVSPRLELFAAENLQAPSALMKLVILWAQLPRLLPMLAKDQGKPIFALRALFENENCKNAVLSELLDCFLSLFTDYEDRLQELDFLRNAIAPCARSFSTILLRSDVGKDVVAKLVQLLLVFLEQQCLTQLDALQLADTLAVAFEAPGLSAAVRSAVLSAISGLITTADSLVEHAQIARVFRTCLKALRHYPDVLVRDALVGVFEAIAAKIAHFADVARILADISSHSTLRIGESDLPRRIRGFTEICDEKASVWDKLQWMPVLNCSIFYMQDVEAVIRANARAVLVLFSKAAQHSCDLSPAFKDVILPSVRAGLRKKEEKTYREYVMLLGDLVEACPEDAGLSDLRIFLPSETEEMSVFEELTHVQVHHVMRAVRRIDLYSSDLLAASAAHYALPMVERYAIGVTDPERRNLANDAVRAVQSLAKVVTWPHYVALMKRSVAQLNGELFGDAVRVVVAVCSAAGVFEVEKNGFVDDTLAQLGKHLEARDESIAIQKVPLSEAMVLLVLALGGLETEQRLPGVLTKTAQILRLRSEALRDAVRKSVGKIVADLGVNYLPFVLRELRGALQRGPQIHILSYTAHHVLCAMRESLKAGDLDACVSTLMHVIVDDLFGASSEEKEAEGYSAKTKEIKNGKSYDTAEILAEFVSLETVSAGLLVPLGGVASSKVTLRTRTRMAELLRRYVIGLAKNTSAEGVRGLAACYEIYTADYEAASRETKTAPTPSRALKNEESAAHFLVQLDVKQVQKTESALFFSPLVRRFALDLLRALLARDSRLALAANLQGFTPLLEDGAKSDDADLTAAALRMLQTVAVLPLDEESSKRVAACARSALRLLKASPTTTLDSAHAALRFLGACVRHKNGLGLKPLAIAYILTRLQPDLESATTQGMAFFFLRAVLAARVALPEVYDCMRAVSKVLVSSHSAEARALARSCYFTFLMEYEHGRGRLEQELQFLLGNLNYPAETGRALVLELVHQIVAKTSGPLLVKIAPSFFVALSQAAVFDDGVRCRTAAADATEELLQRLDRDSVRELEEYLERWLQSDGALVRVGFTIYRVYLQSLGSNASPQLEALFLRRFAETVEGTEKPGDSAPWEAVYSGLMTFTGLFERKKAVFDKFYGSILLLLLYPHTWVRLAAARLVGGVVSAPEDFAFADAEFMGSVAHKSIRQMGAPKLEDALADQAVKNLVHVVVYWQKTGAGYSKAQEKGSASATEWLVGKTCTLAKLEKGNDFAGLKTAAVKLLAMIIQIVEASQLDTENMGLAMMLAVDEESELGAECLRLLEQKIGLSAYLALMARAKSVVMQRRVERRAQRAQLRVTNPEAAAKRKEKKHKRVREKRKELKDELGYYHGKKKRRI